MYEIIYIVLTYIEHKDLVDFITSINKTKDYTYKIIVVNNFFDEESNLRIKNIAKEYSCDFLENENKGYSHGNNKGISYALNKYKFNYLIVSNPDIIIDEFSIKQLEPTVITAPEIIARKGKKQNPYYFSKARLSEWFIYQGYLKRNKLYMYTGIIINKFNRALNRVMMKIKKQNEKEIYALHGSFKIIPYDLLTNIVPVFDENMFLFAEENEFANKISKEKIKIVYNKKIIVKHKEDGSMIHVKNINDIARDSYLYYYNKRIKRKSKKL